MSKAIVTGSVGPGTALSAVTINNVTEFRLIPGKKELGLTVDGVETFYDISGVATITVSVVSSTNFTVTVA
jgi:hypothetical protein